MELVIVRCSGKRTVIRWLPENVHRSICGLRSEKLRALKAPNREAFYRKEAAS